MTDTAILVITIICLLILAIMLFYLVYNSSRDRQNLPSNENKAEDRALYKVQYRDPFEKEFEIFLATISKETDDFRMAIKAWNEYVEERLKEGNAYVEEEEEEIAD